uniref:Uncharacterized protein n=1 Tax=Anguilla anguilla TaxID=7936 RepID=A0A0E9WK44_ANGAN
MHTNFHFFHYTEVAKLGPVTTEHAGYCQSSLLNQINSF